MNYKKQHYLKNKKRYQYLIKKWWKNYRKELSLIREKWKDV